MSSWATFSLTAEQAFVLAQENSPAFVPGAFQLATALVKDEPKITDAFRTRKGVGWHEHNHDLFTGTERFFRPGYVANLVSSWIPALDEDACSTACMTWATRSARPPTC
jgi:hypothetical protein